MADFCGGAGEGNRTLVVSLGRLGRGEETAEIRHVPVPAACEQGPNETGFCGDITASLPRCPDGRDGTKPGTFNMRIREYPPKRPVVYFVQSACGLIKIGTTGNIDLRFAELQRASPSPLTLLATFKGDRKVERQVHRQFAAHRRHGEWFAPHPDILAEIERLNPPITRKEP